MIRDKIDWDSIHERMAAAEAAIADVGHASRDRTRAVLRTRAAELARRRNDGEKPGDTLEVLGFVLGQEKYGIETRYVREVIPLNELTPLPCSPPFVMGIVNLRGQVLSVIDVRILLDLPQRGVGDQDRVIVLRHGNMEFGILANSIQGVVQVPAEGLQATLSTLTGSGADFLRGVSKERMAVLDGGALLADEKVIVREEA